MLYPFPNVKKSCLLCGKKGCARWKGYFIRTLQCSDIEFKGEVAIHVGHCRIKKRDFSYFPSFLIPYRRTSRASLEEFTFKWYQSGSLSEGIEWILEGLDSGSEKNDLGEYKVPMSTAYGWLYALIIPLRLHSEELRIRPPYSTSIQEIRNQSAATIRKCFEPLRAWNPGFEHILAPP
jgi:hypothetical protein